MSEPTEADWKLAEELVPPADVMDSYRLEKRREEVKRKAAIIAKHLAPERAEAARLKSELEKIEHDAERLSDVTAIQLRKGLACKRHQYDKAILMVTEKGQEIERLESEAARLREENARLLSLLRHEWRCPHCGGYDSGGLVLHCSGCGRPGTLAQSVARLKSEISRLTAELAEARAEGERAKTLNHCAAARDGDCIHALCPQLRDGEPHKTGRHCPLDASEDLT